MSDFHYMRFVKVNGKNIDVGRISDADNIYYGMKDMGRLAMVDVLAARRRNEYEPIYYRLWRGKDSPENAVAYMDADPFGNPRYKFRVDSRLVLWRKYHVDKNHVVRFVGYDGWKRYQALLRLIQERARLFFGADYSKTNENSTNYR